MNEKLLAGYYLTGQTLSAHREEQQVQAGKVE